jgi:hypothetical protein
MVVTNVSQHVGVHSEHPDAGRGGEVFESAGGGVAVHAGAGPVEQDRSGGSVADRSVDGPADRWRSRDEDDLGVLAHHAQDAVAVLLTEVVDVGGAGFEDPQPEQPSMTTRAKVAGVGRGAGGDQHGLELQVRQSEGGRLGRDRRPAHVRGRFGHREAWNH